MAQIIDSIPGGQRAGVLCCYVNATSQIQIARISNIANWYFERVVFPGQRLIFEALPKALLEIHTGMMASAILSDTIPVERLQISDHDDSEEELDGKAIASDTDNKTPLESIDHKTPTSINFLKTAVSFC